MKKSPSDILVGQIDALQKRYEDEYMQSQDIKALQGVERCIELKMKLWGLDGKTSVTAATEEKEEPATTVDLGRLSKQTLEEILSQIKEKNV